MKILNQILIISCLLFFINSTCATDEDDTSYKYRKYEDCSGKSFDEEELEGRAYKCCHIEIETKALNQEKEVHLCVPITQSQFDNIKSTINQFLNETGAKEIEIDCKSNFIKFSIFSLILYLF